MKLTKGEHHPLKCEHCARYLRDRDFSGDDASGLAGRAFHVLVRLIDGFITPVRVAQLTSDQILSAADDFGCVHREAK